MKRHYRSGTLERDFHVLFDEGAQWKWPFCGEGIVGTLINLGFTTFFAKIMIGIFIPLDFHRNEFIALAALIFAWETVRLNWKCIRDFSLRRRLRTKYLPTVEHTEAYELLEEAIASRKRGEVEGLGTKEETEAGLIRLWKAAFAEADSLAGPQSPVGSLVDPLEALPVGDHIQRYFSERAASYQEINR